MDDVCFFGEGPLKSLKTGENLPPGSTPDGKNIISVNFLHLYSVAEERTLVVVNEKCFDVPASNTTNRFSMPARFVSEDKASADNIRLIITTLEATALLDKDNGATIPFLKEEFKWLKSLVGKEEGFPSRLGANKPKMVENVLAGRNILNGKFPNALDEHANDKIGMFPVQESDLDTKLFYKLTQKARSVFRDNKRPLTRQATSVPASVTETQQSLGSVSTLAMDSQGIAETQSTAGTDPESQSPVRKRVLFSYAPGEQGGDDEGGEDVGETTI